MSEHGPIRFIIKLAKQCNLRCTYCYEYRELANRQRMSLDAIARMFENIARHVAAHACEFVSFVWHGGEPFMIPLSYYDEIRELQESYFPKALQVHNAVQTNLTIMTERHLDYLKSGAFFSGLGVSFDVHGDQRVDTRGQLKTGLVLNNLQKLIDAGISFGAIAVLARNTLPHVKEIYRFYDRLGIECRFIPFFKTSFAEQIADHAVSHGELVDALKTLFDEWMISETATAVDPIDEYIDYAVAYTTGQRDRRYNKQTDEYAFVVELDGGIWGHGEAYESELKYGNLIDEPFADILKSPGRRRAIDNAQRRIDAHCRHCPYYGACPGSFVADASVQQQSVLDQAGCPVRAVLDHIVAALERSTLSDLVSAQSGRASNKNGALAVAM